LESVNSYKKMERPCKSIIEKLMSYSNSFEVSRKHHSFREVYDLNIMSLMFNTYKKLSLLNGVRQMEEGDNLCFEISTDLEAVILFPTDIVIQYSYSEMNYGNFF